MAETAVFSRIMYFLFNYAVVLYLFRAVQFSIMYIDSAAEYVLNADHCVPAFQ